jgi:hypothetical protein
LNLKAAAFISLVVDGDALLVNTDSITAVSEDLRPAAIDPSRGT